MKVRPLVLNIELSIWKEFTKNVLDTRTKNGTIVELIKKYNEECKNGTRVLISKN